MMKIAGAFILIVTVVSVGFLLDRLGLWMEDRGWIYYRKKEGDGKAAVGNALLQLDSFFQPEKKNVIEMKQELKREQAESGEPPFDHDLNFPDELEDDSDKTP